MGICVSTRCAYQEIKWQSGNHSEWLDTWDKWNQYIHIWSYMYWKYIEIWNKTEIPNGLFENFWIAQLHIKDLSGRYWVEPKTVVAIPQNDCFNKQNRWRFYNIRHSSCVFTFNNSSAMLQPWRGRTKSKDINKTQDTFTTSRNRSGCKNEFRIPEDFNGHPNKTILHTLNSCAMAKASSWPRSKIRAFCWTNCQQRWRLAGNQS